ncbi:3-phosphoshikimate 1-carboxyvinyltransferase [Paracrocinitomix mangrovi]|uniref:3-phosphoshikimate 1-carboxyvinyltransferase n=1 Tax=Paracrocinitomix mangrovi TaxID=2862509 RepID=UPI001C8D5AD2|nr:3-phosphoshikimate 1-carboxyvinyltransferase [Paracrocinitomix mangrovi]UKN02806.1 3-phosphoshikimate 1-carboxyvinyltransferase [Paracrocinitomix mangrovi]
MRLKVNHIDLKEITAPASKSYAQRAILAACLCTEESELYNIGKSDDVGHILNVALQLGAQLKKDGDRVNIKGNLTPTARSLNVGESGLGLRLTVPIAAALGGDYEIVGKGSLVSRPVKQFESFLPQLGVAVTTNNGLLPVEINGQLKGGEITVDGSLSSQFISGLMMALPLCAQDSKITIKNPVSIPYLLMTSQVLSSFGIAHSYDHDIFTVQGKQKYEASNYYVEGDWSGAAFWAVYGAIKGEIILNGLNIHSHQADVKILEAIEKAGGNYTVDRSNIIIRANKLIPFEFDATDCPDLFPPLVVLASACAGMSKIHGVRRLKHKESDRGVVLKNEFNKLGLLIEIKEDTMLIHGTGKLNSGYIHSNNDHRIAMAGAIASVLTEDGIEIENAEAVNKSYPAFWDHIEHE